MTGRTNAASGGESIQDRFTTRSDSGAIAISYPAGTKTFSYTFNDLAPEKKHTAIITTSDSPSNITVTLSAGGKVGIPINTYAPSNGFIVDFIPKAQQETITISFYTASGQPGWTRDMRIFTYR